jgi:hypothetical protein
MSTGHAETCTAWERLSRAQRALRSAFIWTTTAIRVPTVPNAAQPDIADQIRKLAELRDAGILTSEEFEAKKADLLERL